MDRKQLLTVIGGVIGATLGSFAVTHLMRSCSDQANPFDAAIVKVSSDLNTTLPMFIDAETRLDATAPGPGNRLTYLYTLVHMIADSVDTAAFRAYIEPGIRNNYRTMPEMKGMWEHGTELVYSYRDREGNHLLSIIAKPEI